MTEHTELLTELSAAIEAVISEQTRYATAIDDDEKERRRPLVIKANSHLRRTLEAVEQRLTERAPSVGTSVTGLPITGMRPVGVVVDFTVEEDRQLCEIAQRRGFATPQAWLRDLALSAVDEERGGREGK